MKFKTFQTFDRLEKKYSLTLNEADDEATDEIEPTADEGDDTQDDTAEDTGGDMPDGATDMPDDMPDDMGDDATGNTDAGVDPSTDPNQQTDVEAGSFVSPMMKSEYAETLLKALMAPKPELGDIPQEYLNVTPDNADQVIKYVQGLISLNTGLAEADDSETVEALKEV